MDKDKRMEIARYVESARLLLEHRPIKTHSRLDYVALAQRDLCEILDLLGVDRNEVGVAVIRDREEGA